MTKQQLAAKIWATANELRKNIKASEYKDYILGFMFYKYLSDKEIDFTISVGGDMDSIKNINDRKIQNYQDKLGYFISYENLFDTWKENDGKLGAHDVSSAIEAFYQNLNDKYARCFYVYNKEVNKHSGVFDALDSGLSNLGENPGARDRAVRDIVNLVAEIPPKSKEYDVLGYIYEYLIQQFSSEAKKDGAFYTPHEVTELMSRIVAERLQDRSEIKVYDPCVGSGGLLLNMGQACGKYTPANKIKYYGQELITETSNLAKMNLFMRDVPIQNIIVRNANTLDEDWPYFDENTEYTPLFVDAVTANPPYSVHWDANSFKMDERFRQYGIAPDSKADYAFLLHCLYHIKPDGIMSIVLPHGVLFRGGSEEEIRKNLIECNNIETIIGMPVNLFFAVGIPVIVMILSKNRKEDDVLFIDASTSFVKDGNINRLQEKHVQKIYDAVIAREDIPNFARLVSKEEIIENDYNLNIPRYVSANIEETPYDLYSVMTGYVSEDELSQYDDYWNAFPELKDQIIARNGSYFEFKSDDIKGTVFEDKDVIGFVNRFNALAEDYKKYLVNSLIYSESNANTKEDAINSLFERFNNTKLVDKYDVYQVLADNWKDIEIDINRVRKEGKNIYKEIENDIVTKKNSKTKKYEDVVVGMKGKVIPLSLIKSEFFEADFEELQELQNKIDDLVSEYTDVFDSIDDEIKSLIVKDNDETKYDTKKIKQVIKANELEEGDINQLVSMQKAIDDEKKYKKEIKQIEKELDEKAQEKIKDLSAEEVNDLLIKKWIDPIIRDIENVVNRMLSNFVNSLAELKKRYENPLSNISEEEKACTTQLKNLMGELDGNDVDMSAIKMLMEEL